MHFGENQLSRSLIGLSPLSTAHPLGFQPKWVRASTTSYRRFTLAMDRSLRFGSRACDSNALFGLAFATASPPGLTLTTLKNQLITPWLETLLFEISIHHDMSTQSSLNYSNSSAKNLTKRDSVILLTTLTTEKLQPKSTLSTGQKIAGTKPCSTLQLWR